MLGKKVNFNHLKGYLRSREQQFFIQASEFHQGKQVRWGLAWKLASELEPRSSTNDSIDNLEIKNDQSDQEATSERFGIEHSEVNLNTNV
jgi:hypothetical protein